MIACAGTSTREESRAHMHTQLHMPADAHTGTAARTSTCCMSNAQALPDVCTPTSPSVAAIFEHVHFFD